MPSRASLATRGLAAAALVAAIVVIVLIILGGGSGYTVHANFQDASLLVDGNLVQIGPARAGSVTHIGLTRDGTAEVTMKLEKAVAPLHTGTVARIYEDSLSGIASRYVELEPGPASGPKIPSGGAITLTHTYSEVSLDEVFDSLNPMTRAGLRNLIQGEAASLKGQGKAANQALKYLAPGLESTSEVTQELTRDEPAFDKLVVQGAQALEALSSRSDRLTSLISDTASATGAIASESQSLSQALSLLPPTLRRSTQTFVGLDQTLDTLSPVVAASKPNVRQLPQFGSALNDVLGESIPVVAKLNALISSPSGGGDLTTLANSAPELASLGAKAFPELIKQFNQSEPQLDYLREYAPDVVAALSDVGQAGAYYDANGHYVRSQVTNFAFTLGGSNQLSQQFPDDRYDGLQAVRQRCPGSAVQPSPDGSTPSAVSGCDTTDVPSGP